MVIEEIITIGTFTVQIIEIDQEADGTTTGQVIAVVRSSSWLSVQRLISEEKYSILYRS